MSNISTTVSKKGLYIHVIFYCNLKENEWENEIQCTYEVVWYLKHYPVHDLHKIYENNMYWSKVKLRTVHHDMYIATKGMSVM